jgi:hypothetical protein
MAKEKRDQLLHIIAQLDGHFRSDDVSPADADGWKELKRHIVREIGMPMTDDEARKIESYARFGLGVKKD